MSYNTHLSYIILYLNKYIAFVTFCLIYKSKSWALSLPKYHTSSYITMQSKIHCTLKKTFNTNLYIIKIVKNKKGNRNWLFWHNSSQLDRNQTIDTSTRLSSYLHLTLLHDYYKAKILPILTSLHLYILVQCVGWLSNARQISDSWI